MSAKKVKGVNKQREGSSKGCDLSSIYSRLHRINGQVLAVERMLKGKHDCSKVLQQLIAARRALDQVAILILENEAEDCFKSTQSVKAMKNLEKIVTTLFKTV